MRPRTRLILGGPGSGKTAHLMELVAAELHGGVRPERLAFVSFTKAAVAEARGRAQEEFGLAREALPYMRTLHSLCFWKLGARTDEMMGRDNYAKIAASLGVPLSPGHGRFEDGLGGEEGDRMIFIDNLARTTRQRPKFLWARTESGPYESFARWREHCAEFKAAFAKRDFTDLLEEFLREGGPQPVDVAFVDEAQDLTPLEWAVVDLAFCQADRLYVAGDDDQAIYTWAGADVERLMVEEYDERETLKVSHRLPPTILSYAARFIVNHVKNRHEKPWRSARSEPGLVRKVGLESLDALLDLTRGTWYLLARNACFLWAFKDLARRAGVAYRHRGRPSVDPGDAEAIRLYEAWRAGEALSDIAIGKIFKKMGLSPSAVPPGSHHIGRFSRDPGPWHAVMKNLTTDVGYYLMVEAVEGSLAAEPRVTIDTVHAVKGGECDHTVLRTDVTRRSYEARWWGREGFENEARVFYVGATRARESLHITFPATRYCFEDIIL